MLVDRTPDQRPSLLVLAMSHLHNLNLDAIDTENADVLTLERQNQLDEFVRQLATYKPTHIAIERDSREQADVDKIYSDYRTGRYQLTHHEAEQIGFRLARALGLERLHAVDYRELPPGDPTMYNWPEFAERNGQGGILKSLLSPSRIPFPTLTTQNITAWILDTNRPEIYARLHRMNFDIVMFGSEKEQPGAAWVSTSWYGRNLRIFRNLVNLTDRPDDRVLVIFGAGHAHLLRQFAQESGAFQLRELADFVNTPRN